MENEIWKQIIIDEIPTIYEVSSLGNIKNIEKQKILKPNIISEYCNVTLYHNKKRIQQKIHRLVATAFIPNPENKPVVDHIDRNSMNNTLTNLRWASFSENNLNKKKNESIFHSNNRKIECTHSIKNEKHTFVSLREAHKWLFDNKLKPYIKDKGEIANAIHKNKPYCGYQWKYVEEPIHDEVWKNIPIQYTNGVEGYEISSFGRIKITSGRISYGTCHLSGYKNISIQKKSYRIHQLVGILFIPNPENKPYIDHINGEKSDNRIINLRWTTQKENVQNAYDNNQIKTRRVVQYDLEMNKIASFKHAKEAARQLNIDYVTINFCLNAYRDTRYAGGFVFKYEDDESENYKVVKKTHNIRVAQYDKNDNKINIFDSMKIAGETLNINPSLISMACNGKVNYAGGFKFRFE